MSGPFRIDILDSAGDKVGSGPLINILQMDDTRTLDKIGTAVFVVPANDPKTIEIVSGRQFDLFDEVDGYIGRFIFQRKVVSDSEGQAIITVYCWSILRELVFKITGFARQYAADEVEEIVEDLLSDVSGWSLTSGTSLGTANVTYQGQTVYQAIEEISKRWGYHFRLGAGAKELELGSFGDLNTAVRLTNLGGQNRRFDNQSDVAIVKTISQSVSDEEVFNLIIALGAGEGAAQLRLLDGEVGDTYTVQDRTRTNGQVETFIEDAASQAAFGDREMVVIFDQVRPIANTATAKTQAQTELLLNTEKFLERYKDAREQLDNVQVYGLKTDIKVGDKVNIRYKGKDDLGELYLDIDADYWVTQHVRTRNVNGNRLSNLQLVNVDRPEKTDIDLLSEAVRGIRSERLWIKPVAFRFSDTYSDWVANSNGDYQDKVATFTFTFDDTVTDVTRVILEWRTKPIFATSVWSQGGLTQTLNANPTTPHLHALDLSTLATIGLFTILESTIHPTDIVLELNGVDISNHADVVYITGGNGPWKDDGSGSGTELFVRMDITDLIVGNIYQTFTLEFSLNTARSRDIGIPFYTTILPQNNLTGNQGIIELRVISQGVCQAVYKD